MRARLGDPLVPLYALVLLVAGLLLAVVAGCSSGPSAAACHRELAREYAHAIQTGGAGPAPTEPAACRGLSPAVQRSIASAVLNGQ